MSIEHIKGEMWSWYNDIIVASISKKHDSITAATPNAINTDWVHIAMASDNNMCIVDT